jgi:tetratricopeptide (TPR) repeat protein
MMKRWLSTASGSSALTALAAFCMYLWTLAPSVTFIDSGELAAVACTLGIAHPTGYPLFTLLGWMFSRLPIGTEEVVRLNMMSALFCAAGVYFFTLLVHGILAVVAQGPLGSRLRSREIAVRMVLPGAVAAGVLLAFSETVWATATSVEVYSLHLLLLSLILLLFVRAAVPAEPGTFGGGVWLLAAFVIGLGFTNHMTTVLLAPGLLYLYFATQGGGRPAWSRIIRMVPPFLLGLSVYAYLPLRAAQSPLLNWGNPVTLERLLWHFSGKQYRVWIFSSTEAAGRQFQYFLQSLPAEFAYAGLLPALVGLLVLWKFHRRLAFSTILLFTGCVLYAINYDIHDIDSYFLLAYLMVALWAGVGFFAVAFWVRQRWGGPGRFALVVVFIVAFAPFALHSQRADESNNRLVEDYTMNILRPLPPNALIFSYQWDYWLSATYYYQLVRNVRTDVAVVDKELLRRSWYFNELEHRYPWLIADSRSEVAAFLKELDKFEHDLPYDPAVIQGRYVNLISSMMRRSMATRPVYVTHEIEQEFTSGLQRVPEGLAFRLVTDTLFHPSARPVFAYRPFGRSGRLEDNVPKIYASALIARGVYYYRAGEVGEAKTSFSRALEFDPANVEASRWGVLLSGR